jgi:hypothetical protein
MGWYESPEDEPKVHFSQQSSLIGCQNRVTYTACDGLDLLLGAAYVRLHAPYTEKGFRAITSLFQSIQEESNLLRPA